MSQIQITAPSSTPAAPKRVNFYTNIHKAIRAFMGNTLTMVASLDGSDQHEVKAALEQVRSLAGFCTSHFHHENEFVHTAMEARQPGSSINTATDHEHHAWAIEKLLALTDAVEQAFGAERENAINDLRSYIALFIAENFIHMNFEENENIAVLWNHYTDVELMQIEQTLVASIGPEEIALGMRWMIPSINHGERVALLTGMRDHAPQPVFEGVLAIARANLSAYDWHKLVRALALPDRLAA